MGGGAIGAHVDRAPGKATAGEGKRDDSAYCPLCGSQDTWVAKSIEVEPVLREWERTFRLDVRQEFRGFPRFDLRQCGSCYIGYFAPRCLAGSPELYEQLEKHDGYYMPRKWEHDVALKDLRGCQRVVEVGCGLGDFVARARNDGIEIEGIEQNPSAVQQAERRGRPVRLLDLRDLAAQCAGKYHAVCSFQVLEHVPNPGEFLAACCALLARGGKLLLGVPNAESFLRHQFSVLDLPPHHMTRWSAKVFHRVPAMFPLRLERVKREPLAEYHVQEYVDAYIAVATRDDRLSSLCHPRIKALLANSLKRTGARRLLRGHTLYVAFSRV